MGKVQGIGGDMESSGYELKSRLGELYPEVLSLMAVGFAVSVPSGPVSQNLFL